MKTATNQRGILLFFINGLKCQCVKSKCALMTSKIRNQSFQQGKGIELKSKERRLYLS